jgi:hypothetical protein
VQQASTQGGHKGHRGRGKEGVSKFNSAWKRPRTFTFTSSSLKEPKKSLLNERREVARNVKLEV